MIFLTLFLTGVIGAASQLNVGRSLLRRYAKIIFLLAIVSVFVPGAFMALEQYRAWLADPVAKFLIPPYQDAGYFSSYSFSRFFAPYLLPLLAGLAFLIVALVFNKRSSGKFFEKEEPYLAALSIFLVGHPGWLVYFIALILVYLLIHVSRAMTRGQSERLPLYRLWVPTAFFVIILNEYWLSHTHWWALISI